MSKTLYNETADDETNIIVKANVAHANPTKESLLTEAYFPIDDTFFKDWLQLDE